GSGPDEPPLHYFVMEYVPGQDLEEAVRANGRFAPDEACGLVYQVASALAEAHKHDLVHRDIKPSNIRVTPDGQAKLLDFGLVRHFHNRLTEQGAVLGTLDYISPEQARDASSVDIRADIYSLGGTLFWCLTGRLPFETGGNGIESVLRKYQQAVPPLHRYAPDVPPEMDAVMARMLAVKPDGRYAN